MHCSTCWLTIVIWWASFRSIWRRTGDGNHIPADDDERKFIEREGFDALDNDDKPETGSRGYFDPSFSFDTLAQANKCAAELTEQGSVGIWIDVLKPDGDDWCADYFIETHKGETR